MCELVGECCGLSCCERTASGESLLHSAPFSIRTLQLPEGQSQMLRAAKVFTKVTCVFASASLRLLSLWPLLLSRAL